MAEGAIIKTRPAASVIIACKVSSLYKFIYN
jgi:hypothetical protein